jgi:hypothetical protein
MAKRMMGTNTLNVVKGLTQISDLDYHAKFNAAELGLISGGVVPQGRCVHVGADGTLKLGCGDGQLAMWMFQGTNEADVDNSGAGNPANVYGAWVPMTPSGNVKCYVATGGFEMNTTEFKNDVAYAPNDHLEAPVSDGVPANMLSTAGKLRKTSVKPYSHNVVAVVSRIFNPSSTPRNSHGQFELHFWPVYLPKIAGIAEPSWAI